MSGEKYIPYKPKSDRPFNNMGPQLYNPTNQIFPYFAEPLLGMHTLLRSVRLHPVRHDHDTQLSVYYTQRSHGVRIRNMFFFACTMVHCLQAFVVAGAGTGVTDSGHVKIGAQGLGLYACCFSSPGAATARRAGAGAHDASPERLGCTSVADVGAATASAVAALGAAMCYVATDQAQGHGGDWEAREAHTVESKQTTCLSE